MKLKINNQLTLKIIIFAFLGVVLLTISILYQILEISTWQDRDIIASDAHKYNNGLMFFTFDNRMQIMFSSISIILIILGVIYLLFAIIKKQKYYDYIFGIALILGFIPFLTPIILLTLITFIFFKEKYHHKIFKSKNISTKQEESEENS